MSGTSPGIFLSSGVFLELEALINISFIKISGFLLETFKSAFYMRNLTYIITIGIFSQKIRTLFSNFWKWAGEILVSLHLPPSSYAPGYPSQKHHPLFFAKPSFKSTNCPLPLFRQSPLYIRFFMTPLLKSDFSVNPHNILPQSTSHILKVTHF